MEFSDVVISVLPSEISKEPVGAYSRLSHVFALHCPCYSDALAAPTAHYSPPPALLVLQAST